MAIANEMNMNKVDEEILGILKETFRKKKGEFIDRDEVMVELILKLLLFLSLGILFTSFVMFLAGKEMPSGTQSAIATPISLFFGLLFIHINNKSKNMSVIMFVLTWVSMVISLYFS